MSDLPSRDAIVATAGESIARGSKSFAAASRLFDRRTRERAWLLYAWCRKCDDLADGQEHGHGMTIVEDAPARLLRLSAMTDAALAGDWVGDPAFDALRIVAAETRMPKRFAHDLIAGFALDAQGWRPQSEADLMRYCYHVAGYYDGLVAFYHKMADVGFLRPQHRDILLIDTALDRLLAQMADHAPVETITKMRASDL